MTDQEQYIQLQSQQEKAWEDACRSCGACCGIFDGDPCEFLTPMENGKHFCRIYENRLGRHKTRAGRDFECVPLRQILHKSWPGDGLCAYKRKDR